MNKFVWQDPPAVKQGRQSRLLTDDIISILKTRPNEWLYIGEGNRLPWHRSVQTFGAGQIELTSRNNKGPKADIYLRWTA